MFTTPRPHPRRDRGHIESVCRDFGAQPPYLASHIAAARASWHDLRRNGPLGVSASRPHLALHNGLCAWIANVRVRFALLSESRGWLLHAVRHQVVWGSQFAAEVLDHCLFLRGYGVQMMDLMRRLDE
jgi:hypothetical protein